MTTMKAMKTMTSTTNQTSSTPATAASPVTPATPATSAMPVTWAAPATLAITATAATRATPATRVTNVWSEASLTSPRTTRAERECLRGVRHAARRALRRTTRCGGAGALAVWACVAMPLAGCDRSGVQSQQVAKGVERIPDEATPVPPAATAESSARNPDRPWSVPEGWSEDAAPRPMRLTTYVAPDSSGPVEVAVTRFGGRVGGALANINRWRGQMGLPPVDETGLEATIVRFASPGFDGYEVRIESERGVMLAAAVYEASIDQTWFVRATVANAEAADRLEAELFGMARSIAGPPDDGGE